MKTHLTHEFTRENADGTESEFEADIAYSPGDPGCRTMRNGDPGWPPDPPNVEFLAVFEMRDGKRVREIPVESLTENEIDNLSDRAQEEVESASEAREEDSWDRDREERMDA